MEASSKADIQNYNKEKDNESVEVDKADPDFWLVNDDKINVSFKKHNTNETDRDEDDEHIIHITCIYLSILLGFKWAKIQDQTDCIQLHKLKKASELSIEKIRNQFEADSNK